MNGILTCKSVELPTPDKPNQRQLESRDEVEGEHSIGGVLDYSTSRVRLLTESESWVGFGPG